MIETRVLSPDDWAIWRGLRLAALADAPHAFGSRLADWQDDGDREQRWRARLEIPGYHVAAVLDGQPVGVASGVPTEEDSVVELISMWVSPSARGRGVGNHLLQEVQRWARQVGAALLTLAVAQDNQHASALYERNGFRYTGQADLMPDGERHEYIMAKRLSI